MSGAVLVTGGAGFIGSHLVERLLQRGRGLVCLDNFDPYYSAQLKHQNLRVARAMAGFSLVEGDIADEQLLRQLFSTHRFDAVIHLAARPGVRPSLKDPAPYVAINVGGTVNLLEMCKIFAIPRFVYASSSSVYGNVAGAATEDRMSCRPLSPYGASKVAGEAFCQAYAALYGLSIMVLRLFTVYGPRQRPDMAVSRFTRLVAAGEEVHLYGDGSSRRDYTYVSDIISGIEAALDLPQGGVHVLNLGASRPVPLGYLVQVVEENLAKKARVRLGDPEPGDPESTFADISKASSLLGYRPLVPIEEGVRLYVEWYRDTQREHGEA